MVDLFACSLDQVGVAEMKVCVEKTGGLLVLDDSFTHNVFTGSFKRVFAVDQKNELVMSFNGELQVLTSREFKVAGAIGCCTSLERKSPSVAESGASGLCLSFGRSVACLTGLVCRDGCGQHVRVGAGRSGPDHDNSALL